MPAVSAGGGQQALEIELLLCIGDSLRCSLRTGGTVVLWFLSWKTLLILSSHSVTLPQKGNLMEILDFCLHSQANTWPGEAGEGRMALGELRGCTL